MCKANHQSDEMKMCGSTIEPPKDRRILGFGLLGLEKEEGWGTVKWDKQLGYFVLDPAENTEFLPEPCSLTAWLDLPPSPRHRNSPPA